MHCFARSAARSVGDASSYHVSDTYIALFSHFIPCGVWEAVYILDGLLKNESDIQPDVLHADTQGQSEPVFAFAHLPGIELMPRIRNWNLIETHLPDMLRVALSMKAGRVSASTILRRLGTYSRKNRLYQAFCELGRVIRTGFLLRYISFPGAPPPRGPTTRRRPIRQPLPRPKPSSVAWSWTRSLPLTRAGTTRRPLTTCSPCRPVGP
jgi:TnpA family transposase